MKTLEKIRAEIQKVLDKERDFTSKEAKAQAIALNWCIDIIDKYAEQEPKAGHWIIDKGSLDAFYGEVCKCSECGVESIGESDFCPNCGAKMIEPQESEDEE